MYSDDDAASSSSSAALSFLPYGHANVDKASDACCKSPDTLFIRFRIISVYADVTIFFAGGDWPEKEPMKTCAFYPDTCINRIVPG